MIIARESVKVPKKQYAEMGILHRIFQEKGSLWDETLERSNMDAEGAMQAGHAVKLPDCRNSQA